MQKVIFADLTFIRSNTPKFRGGNDFYKTNHSKIRIFLRILAENSSFRSNFPISAKGEFREFVFYKTNLSEKWLVL